MSENLHTSDGRSVVSVVARKSKGDTQKERHRRWTKQSISDISDYFLKNGVSVSKRKVIFKIFDTCSKLLSRLLIVLLTSSITG